MYVCERDRVREREREKERERELQGMEGEKEEGELSLCFFDRLKFVLTNMQFRNNIHACQKITLDMSKIKTFRSLKIIDSL